MEVQQALFQRAAPLEHCAFEQHLGSGAGQSLAQQTQPHLPPALLLLLLLLEQGGLCKGPNPLRLGEHKVGMPGGASHTSGVGF